MILAIEVVDGEAVGDAIPRIRREHEAAEHGLFGLDRMRRHAQRFDVAREVPAFGLRGHRSGSSEKRNWNTKASSQPTRRNKSVENSPILVDNPVHSLCAASPRCGAGRVVEKSLANAR
jgi:hypothetical protein